MSLMHFQTLKELINDSDKSGVIKNARGLSGYSGNKIIGMLQRIASYQNSTTKGCYFEVGVFQGLTLLSVASVLKEGNVFGVDNFSQFDPDLMNQKIINERIKLNELDNVHLINMDYEDALIDLNQYIGKEKIGTYFVDGPHDYRSQLICLELIKPYLSENAVIVVDDCNYRHVRLANRDFLLINPQFKLLFEAYTYCHPANMPEEMESEARKGWWNGINVLVHDSENILQTGMPPTLRDRRIYVNEHIIHSSKYSYYCPEILTFFSTLMSLRLFTALKRLIRIIGGIKKSNGHHIGRYISMNTYSDKLPSISYNAALNNSS